MLQILLFQKEIILHNLYTLWKNMQAQSQYLLQPTILYLI